MLFKNLFAIQGVGEMLTCAIAKIRSYFLAKKGKKLKHIKKRNKPLCSKV